MGLQCAIANACFRRATRFTVLLKYTAVSVLVSIRLVFHRDTMSINLLLFVRNSYRIWISTLEDPLVKWFPYKEKKYGHITGVIPNLPQDSSR